MVCPLTEGAAIPQHTRNMLQQHPRSKTFWVLTRYDFVLTQRTLVQTLKRQPQGNARRQNADSLVQKFVDEIDSLGSPTRVFKHAAALVIPDSDFDPRVENWLSRRVAAEWLQNIKSHTKECFVALQQEEHVLNSQSNQCSDIFAAVLQEYAKVKDSVRGAQCATDYYMSELQRGVEETIEETEREIRGQIDAVTVESELIRLARVAGEKVRQNGIYTCEKHYTDDLIQMLAPDLESEMRMRLGVVLAHANEQFIQKTRRLLQSTSSELPIVASVPVVEVHHASTDSLAARYPVESAAMLSMSCFGAGMVACTESGALALGVTLVGTTLTGLVVVSMGGIALAGVGLKKASEYNPFWKYEAAEKSAALNMRQTNPWALFKEAMCARTRSKLLADATKFRFYLSKMLLMGDTQREVLVHMFPDYPIFETIHEKLRATCESIQEFTSAPDLKVQAASNHRDCIKWASMRRWREIIDATESYVAPNARTDSIDGKVLASLLILRCEALRQNNLFQDGIFTARVCRRLFPELLFPRIYETGLVVLLESLAGTLSPEPMLSEVEDLLTSLESSRGSYEVPEVPLPIQAWFYVVCASFLGSDKQTAYLMRLFDIVDLQIAVQRPSWQRCLDGCPDSGDEARQSGAEEELWEAECSSFAGAVVSHVHLLLQALPLSQMDVKNVGAPLLDEILLKISAQIRQPPPLPTVEKMIESGLCPIDGANIEDLPKDWEQLLRTALNNWPQRPSE
eukprot:NODE_1081_length_2617_cov_5.896787.p1 GENE.NODE_1081_length_2617_cov_5.896787~~NODE_1081_length_2617_cov_5.896787.p1  ORF type:complete len:741 (-),score=160.01 NODE_1081_length_2617_cov_5.896787:362-2584(-)